jgi:uncharacterized membrane protein
MPDVAAAVPGVAGTPRRFRWAGYLIGIALGGFFDGILLHQVLQWHHLLSLVDSPVLKDIRAQILADGLFHVLMYLVALWGLALLWRSRQAFADPSGGRMLAACVLLGFGLWNIIDVVLFHWVLVIHRIRVDSAVPLLWDIGWLLLFGPPFLVAAWALRRRAAGGSGPGSGSGAGKRPGANASAAMVAVLTLGAGMIAALPPTGNGTALVVFAHGTTPLQALKAIDAADLRIVGSDRSATVWAVHAARRGDAMKLYRHGALLVSGSMLAPGCFNWLARS